MKNGDHKIPHRGEEGDPLVLRGSVCASPRRLILLKGNKNPAVVSQQPALAGGEASV